MDDQPVPGSRSRVLKNLLGITKEREMDFVEAREHLGDQVYFLVIWP
jgi:hypothetical protein